MRSLPFPAAILALVAILVVANPTPAQETRAATVPPPAPEKRVATPADFVDLRVASDPQISPDGRWISFVVREPGDPKKPDQPGDANIWLVPADGSGPPRPFATSPKKEALPRWSPDGRFLAFLSDRGEPIGEDKEAQSQIYLLRTDGGDAQPLTAAPGGVEDLRWSEDGGAIAFLARDGLTDEERKREKEKDDRVYVDHEFKFARLFTVTLADRKVRQVTKQDLEVTYFAWSPDGRQIAAIVAPTPLLNDTYWNGKLVVLDRDSGEIARELSGTAAANVEWSPDGRTIFFQDWTPERIGNLPAIVAASGGPVRRLLGDYKGSLMAAKWLPDSRRLLGEALEGTRQYLVRLDAAAGTLTRAEPALHSEAAFSLNRDGSRVAFLQDAADAPGDVWIASAKGTPRRLTTLNPQLAQLRLGALEEITWKNPKDGQLVYGLVITPPDFRPGRPYPTIVQVHGGPEWAWWTGWHGSWHEWGQLLASHGYVVLLPNPRGSDGQGVRFAMANRDDWGGGDLQDIMAGVDTLIAQGIADPERLGIGGWSYGGYMTSWTVTQTQRFKAAVVGAGVTDLFSFHGTTDITPTFLKSYFRELPYGRRATYDAHSAMAFVQNVKTPSLILHGGSDVRVPPGQGVEFYAALKQLGVPAEMVTYPREPHGLRERAHQLDLLTRILAWFDRYLIAGPGPRG